MKYEEKLSVKLFRRGADGDIIPFYNNADFTTPLDSHHYRRSTIKKKRKKKRGSNLSKEVRDHNLARGEISVVRLAAVTPLSLPTLLCPLNG